MTIDDVEMKNNKSAQEIIAECNAILDSDDNNINNKKKEEAIYTLGDVYAKSKRTEDVATLLRRIRPFFNTVPKAKTAKIVRTLIDLVAEVPDSVAFCAELCKESIAWCEESKRTFLRLRIQARLADLYLKMKQYKDAIKLITRLVYEIKKIDDKLLLVEIQLIESRVHHALKNIPKAKGALTSARSAATAIYCPPLLQADIDMQAGILCGEEKDYKTGFSYFFEAFEGWNTANKNAQAVVALKYMLLCKMMTDSVSDVYSIIKSKVGIKYAGVDVEAMKAIADAHKERSIHSFQRVLEQYKPQLVEDAVIFGHLDELYENLLEQNLMRLIEPFSRVEIAHVAKLIDLPLKQVEGKLSEMILDDKLLGTLDQGAGVLVIFEEVQEDATYTASLNTMKELSGVVDKLYARAKKVAQ